MPVPNTVATFLGNGNVGIGTTNPQNKLTVQQSAVTNAPSRSSAVYLENDANCEIQMVGNSANNIQLRMGTSGHSFDGALDYNLPHHRLDVYTNSTRQVTIDSNGNVGIGTDNPSTLLHLAGSTPIFTIEDKSGANPASSRTCLLRDDDSYQVQIRNSTGSYTVIISLISPQGRRRDSPPT